MSIETPHPDYDDNLSEWQMMRDTIDGAGAVKSRGAEYLPMPSGFAIQPDQGKDMYGSYKTRAQFPELVAPAIGGMVGVIHQSEFQIEIPDSMIGIWENATKDGLSLEAFHRRVTRELLSTGRYAILAEAPEDGGDPYLAGYDAESLINWSPSLDMFVLNESGLVRKEYTWEEKAKYRALLIEDGRYVQRVVLEGIEQEEPVVPQAKGGKPLTEIPFVVMSARDLDVKPEKPPLIGVSRAALAIFRLDADYRHQLFMSGQETLVIINGDAPEAIGAGVIITLQGDENNKPDAKYVGPTGAGIAAHKIAIDDDRKAAAQAGAKLFDTEIRAQESGEARRLRFGAETASLVSIAQASASGIEKALKHIAIMIGANPDEVIVKPPANLLSSTMSPQDATALVKTWQDGAISYTTLYENLQRGQIASVERDADDELKLIDDETFREDADPEGAGIVPPQPPVDEAA